MRWRYLLKVEILHATAKNTSTDFRLNLSRNLALVEVVEIVEVFFHIRHF
jgi:hypothetical protein